MQAKCVRAWEFSYCVQLVPLHGYLMDAPIKFFVASRLALAEFRGAVKIMWKAIKSQGKLTRDKCFSDVNASFLPTRFASLCTRCEHEFVYAANER